MFISGGSRPSAKEGARLTMDVEFCEDNSGTSKKMRYFRKNKVGATPPLDLPLFIILLIFLRNAALNETFSQNIVGLFKMFSSIRFNNLMQTKYVNVNRKVRKLGNITLPSFDICAGG